MYITALRQRIHPRLAAQGATCAGIVLGWTSPILPYLQISSIERGEAPITSEESSWIASLLPLGALVGALVGGYCADVFGRKWTILGSAIPYFVGLALCAVSTSVPCIYAGRFIAGISLGITTTINPIYVDEIAEDSVRGALGIYLELMSNTGVLWSFVVGSFAPFLWFSISSAVIPVIFFGAFIWMPESPTYLIATGHELQAIDSLKWLRAVKGNENKFIENEIHVLKSRMFRQTIKTSYIHESRTFSSIIVDLIANLSFKSPTFKACFIILGLMTIQQICGIDAIMFNIIDIFEYAGTGLSSRWSCVIVGIIQLIGTAIAFLIVDRVGRRILLLISLSLMTLCYTLLSLNFGLANYNREVTFLSFVPLFSVSLYFISFSVGLGPIPWFMIAELSPSEHKETIISATVSYSWLLIFFVTKYFASMIFMFGSMITYGSLSVVCVLGVTFVAIFVPETKGRSREQTESQLAETHKTEVFFSTTYTCAVDRVYDAARSLERSLQRNWSSTD
uniref:(California timema) hypothetical protein n=1 Tax=Timema californicum TaxID=61474 RepID=A0A7R9JDY2_TIMCA|nr:unnamed protein product [Timema californicum]